MALISCPECGHQVADTAPACPSCGFPVARMVPPPAAGDMVVVSRRGFALAAAICAVPGTLIAIEYYVNTYLATASENASLVMFCTFMLVAVICNFTGWYSGKRNLVLTASLLYIAAFFIYGMFGIFVFLPVVFGFIGYSRMRPQVSYTVTRPTAPPSDNTTSRVAPHSVPHTSPEPSEEKTLRDAMQNAPIKHGVNGIPLTYCYRHIKFRSVVPPPSVDSNLKDVATSPYCDIVLSGDEIHMIRENAVVGIVDFSNTGIISDFNGKSDPVVGVITHWSDAECFVHLCFYRDKQEPYYGRPFDLVRLVRFDTDSAQSAILEVPVGAMLEYDEDDEVEGRYNVTHYSGCIGGLPTSVSRKLSSHDIEAIFLDSTEDDSDDIMITIPFVRIYWRYDSV